MHAKTKEWGALMQIGIKYALDHVPGGTALVAASAIVTSILLPMLTTW